MKRYLFFLFLIIGCSSPDKPSIYYGEINVGIDESVFKVIEAQTEAYAHKYRGASFNNFAIPENKAVELLLKDSMDVICITRLLTDEEMRIVEEDKGIKYRPAPMAHDAVILIVHPESELGRIDFERLRDLFTGKDQSLKMVFDVGNSSNLNLVLKELGLEDFDRENVVAAGNNEKVFERIQKDRNAIGFVGFNLISESKSAETVKLRESVKVLPVSKDGEYVLAERMSMLDKTYPFSRIIYMHTLGNAWTVENGFIRFACSQPGQLIADKMGLVSYYFLPSEFYMTQDPIDY